MLLFVSGLSDGLRIQTAGGRGQCSTASGAGTPFELSQGARGDGGSPLDNMSCTMLSPLQRQAAGRSVVQSNAALLALKFASKMRAVLPPVELSSVSMASKAENNVHTAAKLGDWQALDKMAEAITSDPSLAGNGAGDREKRERVLTKLVSAPDAKGNPPLCLAAQHGQLEAAAFFLNHGADINGPDGYDTSPLAVAAAHGRWWQQLQLVWKHVRRVESNQRAPSRCRGRFLSNRA